MSFTAKMKALNLTGYELERRILTREKLAHAIAREIKTLKRLKSQALHKEAVAAGAAGASCGRS
jgi:hypothetical protein